MSSSKLRFIFVFAIILNVTYGQWRSRNVPSPQASIAQSKSYNQLFDTTDGLFSPSPIPMPMQMQPAPPPDDYSYIIQLAKSMNKNKAEKRNNEPQQSSKKVSSEDIINKLINALITVVTQNNKNNEPLSNYGRGPRGAKSKFVEDDSRSDEES